MYDSIEVAEQIERLQARCQRLTEERDDLDDRVRYLAGVYLARAAGVVTDCAVADCPEPRAAKRTELPLCMDHLMQAAGDYGSYLQSIPSLERLEDWAGRRRYPKANAAVYYVRVGNRVKIGTTVSLVRRLRSFRAVHPDAQLLALEPGNRERERERHDQFKDAQIGTSEVFELTPELEEHIALVRETFGDPAPFLVA